MLNVFWERMLWYRGIVQDFKESLSTQLGQHSWNSQRMEWSWERKYLSLVSQSGSNSSGQSNKWQKERKWNMKTKTKSKTEKEN